MQKFREEIALSIEIIFSNGGFRDLFERFNLRPIHEIPFVPPS